MLSQMLLFLFLAYQKQYMLSRGVATEGSRVRGRKSPPFNFRTRKGSIVSVSNIRDTAFYECSEIIQAKNFKIFTLYPTIFGQFTVASDYTGELDHFTLDLL